MSNQVFHFSNIGISSGQRFYLKDNISGIFLRNLVIDSNSPIYGSNLVETDGTIKKIISMSQITYNNLDPNYDVNTMYVITGV